MSWKLLLTIYIRKVWFFGVRLYKIGSTIWMLQFCYHGNILIPDVANIKGYFWPLLVSHFDILIYYYCIGVLLIFPYQACIKLLTFIWSFVSLVHVRLLSEIYNYSMFTACIPCPCHSLWNQIAISKCRHPSHSREKCIRQNRSRGEKI